MCKSAVPHFVDNGDGTVTDNQTGLMWEKKSPSGTGDVHDVNNLYDWSISGTAADGTLFTNFLARLNRDVSSNGNATCFANFCDWRIPTVVELQGILLAPSPCDTSPCIDPAFGPTNSQSYWSNSSPLSPLSIWSVSFSDGTKYSDGVRTNPHYARAVRGGR
jgi:hypothetical protein